jgi:LysR family transcriptional regulator, hydrogen peroxide-inducible genes activator
MEMHQIRYFIEAARTRNFTRAAEACCVSPPSLLRAIKLLEEEFGGKLFNRERANTHLTELGKIALPHLQQVLKEAQDAKAKTKDFLGRESSNLSLGIMCTVAPHLFVELTRNFRERHPGISLKLLDATAQKLQASLLAGELEAAIYCIPGSEDHRRIHTLPLFEERMVIAVAKNSPLARKKAITGADLNGEPYLDRINCEVGDFGERQFAAFDSTSPTTFQSERDDWVLAMVAAGLGYGFLPESSASFPGVVARPLVRPDITRTVNLATVRGRMHTPAVGAFVREVMRTPWQGIPALALRQERRLIAAPLDSEDEDA